MLKNLKWTVCYEIVTEDSIEQGEVEEHGWVDSAGTGWALNDRNGYHQAVLESAKSGEFDCQGGVRDFLEDVRKYSCTHPNQDEGGWLESWSNDSELPSKNYSIHLSGCNCFQIRRLHRLAEDA